MSGLRPCMGLQKISLSLYYYLRVIRSVFMDKTESPIANINVNPYTKLGLLICGAGIILVGLLSWIYDYILNLV